MKKCPYCAEEIQDEAIICRYCHSDLRAPFPTGGASRPGTGSPASAPPADPDPPVVYTHSGQRYVLGYSGDYFGIWDRQSPSGPVERFARSDEGWGQAWQRYVGLEPSNVEVAKLQTQQPPAEGGAATALQYTHSGQRYLLGYGQDFFGIWERQNLAQPVRRFPRTDDGWRAAWQQFITWEPHSAEVGIGPSQT